METPRPEYPRPQFRREEWLCLNGAWSFEIDRSDSGLERGLLDGKLSSEIIVPFCPESELSGIGDTDFLNAAWYRRKVDIPESWGAGRRILLHFQACDYDTTVWVNGREVGRHRGGFTPFFFDITENIAGGSEAEITVRARDPRHQRKPSGKQAWKYENSGCMYTRVTGIWQTVWMEPVAEAYLLRPRITPDMGGRRFIIEQPVKGRKTGFFVRAVLSADGENLAEATKPADGDFTPLQVLEIPENSVRPWSLEDPFLYDLRLELLDAGGNIIDSAESYAGLRSITIDGRKVKLNGRPVFQRLVLDQGYYPDGIWTAPDDETLKRDIELSIAAGFNGARLHQKVFEERFLYHADRMGYLVWGEFGDWGIRGLDHPKTAGWKHTVTWVGQWLEVLARDYSHPSIIGWCPLNETIQQRGDRIDDLDDITLANFLAARAFDLTRPLLDASGYSHRVPDSDIYDTHDYTQAPAEMRGHYAALAENRPWVNGSGADAPHLSSRSIPYGGQPFFVSEFGGTWWNPEAAENEPSWGYGDRPKTEEEFMARFEGLCSALLDNPRVFGYCYTQLTDVFQEQNGLYYFNRRPKFDMKRVREIQRRSAAIERNQ